MKKHEDTITPEVIKKHGITEEEYEKILGFLNRVPTLTELGIFSVMWSEHCSYKHSRAVLKLFPTEGPGILVKAGEENAGVIDIGEGWAISFKVESHNHPSAIEPFQGAATGIGGIIRDIFTMGARPIALMDPLRFGDVNSPKVQSLLKGVVSGIAHYGNCIGIPTVGGETYFDDAYEGNPLVNVFCLGILRHEKLARGAATGVGNSVVYVGAATGRDGIHGATFASEELDDNSIEDRSAVQVGDPFLEKLLLEACLELLHGHSVVGIQDMGAAGLTCSTCETASRGGSGIEIDISKVPMRETGMNAYETMLSESQERMLMIVENDQMEKVNSIFEKWDLHAVEIGKVNNSGIMTVKNGSQVVAEIPVKALTDEAPAYHSSPCKPVYIEKAQNLSDCEIPEQYDLGDIILRLLGNPNIACKRWVWEQYDHMVMTNTVVLPGSDAAVIRLKETNKLIAMSSDGNGRYCYLDPYEGGKIAVAESARNIVCSGAKPLAVTDCMNFGNPTKNDVAWQFRKCVEGMSEACECFSTPVTGGNVSFYNENPWGAIDPTPIVGMVGLIEKEEHVRKQWFPDGKGKIILVGPLGDEIGGSLYLKEIHGLKRGLPPRMNLKTEKGVQDFVLKIIKKGDVLSAHDVSDGGLAIALAESCINIHQDTITGIDAKIPVCLSGREDFALFGETQSRIILSAVSEKADDVIEQAAKGGVQARIIGDYGVDSFCLKVGSKSIKIELPEIKQAYLNTLEELLKRNE
ncbi:MAG: phosphoribosylformylglycinamidine synthase subunit PurL [Candidatus Theseobacter exili]|nr:phosphoribosylformylglycinamidine synthase subunit PurL [Candidatus Theseobacter exili]